MKNFGRVLRMVGWASNIPLALGFSSGHAQTPQPDFTPTEQQQATVRDGRIGYALTARRWAFHLSETGKKECPQGFNLGPREQFVRLFPGDTKKRSLVDSQLVLVADTFFPNTSRDPIPFKGIVGNVGLGMNLDSKIKKSDFTSPEGERGIDNQFFRALGCTVEFRNAGGTFKNRDTEYLRRFSNENRFMIELSGVADLRNASDVTVRAYRGLDPLMTDATGGGFIAGGTQRIDKRWAKFADATWKGRIVDGVLTTEPADVTISSTLAYNTTALLKLKAYRLRLRLTPQGAEGLMAGYMDVDAFLQYLNTASQYESQGIGQYTPGSVYRELRRRADGYPDPKTHQMTSISSAIAVRFTQVYIVDPTAKNAANSAQANTQP